MIRAARHRAGLTQEQLASRAGTAAPNISAYENGGRQPRGDVLLRLVAAAGLEPVLVVSGTRSNRYVDLLCDALADRVRADPQVLGLADAELDRRRPNENARAWRSVLEAGPAAVIAALTSRDPDARGLKADNPFARLGLVDEDTRLGLLEQARGR